MTRAKIAHLSTEPSSLQTPRDEIQEATQSSGGIPITKIMISASNAQTLYQEGRLPRLRLLVKALDSTLQSRK